MDFCGSLVKVELKRDGPDCLFGFRKYDNGVLSKLDVIHSSHPNMLRGVIVGKKSWGLFCGEWSEGIAEGSFTKEEILGQFEKEEIKIPDSLKLEFDNRIRDKKIKFLERNWEEYKKAKRLAEDKKECIVANC